MHKIYTPQEIADILKVKISTVYEYCRTGKLSASRLGNRYRITESQLQDFLEKTLTKHQDQPQSGI